MVVQPLAALWDGEHDTSLIIPEVAEFECGELWSVALRQLLHAVEQCRSVVTLEDRHTLPMRVEHENP